MFVSATHDSIVCVHHVHVIIVIVPTRLVNSFVIPTYPSSRVCLISIVATRSAQEFI